MLRQVIGFMSAMAIAGPVTGAVAAESKRLTGEMLNETVPGSTIALDTPIGTKIPMRFGADGIVTGEAGILASYLGSAKDRGRWTVENHKLCIKWFRWFESQPRCMEVTIDGQRITWLRDDGDTGTGMIVEVGQGRVAEKKVSAAKQTVALKQAVATAAASTGQPVPPTAALSAQSPTPADAAPVASPAAEAPAAVAAVEPPASEVAVATATPLAPELQMNVGAALPATATAPADTTGPAVAVLNPGAAPSPAELSAAEPAVSAAVRAATPPAQPVAEVAAEPSASPAVAAAAVPPAAAAPAKPRFSPVRETIAPNKPVTAKKTVVAGVAGIAPPKPAKAAAAKPSGPSFRVSRVEPDDMLNIRQGPSEQHAAVGVISSNGRGVKIVGACAGEWCPVKHGGVSGWVNRYYLVAE